MTRIGIIGADGRMGRAIAGAVVAAGAALAGGIGRDGDADALARTCDVLVDFSSPAALEAGLIAARRRNIPILIGTTGLDAGRHALIDDAAREVAILQAANTSLGVNLLAAEGRGIAHGPAMRTDRNRAREEGSIGYASLRGGSVAGDHLVVLAGDGERIELGHRAESRAIFARGAVRAALWLVGKPAGRYTMAEMLGL